MPTLWRPPSPPGTRARRPPAPVRPRHRHRACVWPALLPRARVRSSTKCRSKGSGSRCAAVHLRGSEGEQGNRNDATDALNDNIQTNKKQHQNNTKTTEFNKKSSVLTERGGCSLCTAPRSGSAPTPPRQSLRRRDRSASRPSVSPLCKLPLLLSSMAFTTIPIPLSHFSHPLSLSLAHSRSRSTYLTVHLSMQTIAWKAHDVRLTK